MAQPIICPALGNCTCIVIVMILRSLQKDVTTYCSCGSYSYMVWNHKPLFQTYLYIAGCGNTLLDTIFSLSVFGILDMIYLQDHLSLPSFWPVAIYSKWWIMKDMFLLSLWSNLDAHKHLGLQEGPAQVKYLISFHDTWKNHTDVSQWRMNTTEQSEWGRNLWDDNQLCLLDFKLFA